MYCGRYCLLVAGFRLNILAAFHKVRPLFDDGSVNLATDESLQNGSDVLPCQCDGWFSIPGD